MLIIAHRGNLGGPVPEKENDPTYLRRALDEGFGIEVDIWKTSAGLFLGHDGPRYCVDETIFESLPLAHVWYHAKNPEALAFLRQKENLHCFWHQEDEYTLTSRGYIWVHARSPFLPKGSICVLPEIRNDDPAALRNCAGICTDFAIKYRDQFHD